jgi:hypothetical protein
MLEHVARRNFNGVPILPSGIVDDLRGWARGPWRGAQRRQIGYHHQIAFGVKRLAILFEADIVASDGLVEYRDRQMDRVELVELLNRHGLAAGNTRNIRHRAVDFLDPVLLEPIFEGFRGRAALHQVSGGVGSIFGSHRGTLGAEIAQVIGNFDWTVAVQDRSANVITIWGRTQGLSYWTC